MVYKILQSIELHLGISQFKFTGYKLYFIFHFYNIQ